MSVRPRAASGSGLPPAGSAGGCCGAVRLYRAWRGRRKALKLADELASVLDADAANSSANSSLDGTAGPAEAPQAAALLRAAAADEELGALARLYGLDLSSLGDALGGSESDDEDGHEPPPPPPPAHPPPPPELATDAAGRTVRADGEARGAVALRGGGSAMVFAVLADRHPSRMDRFWSRRRLHLQGEAATSGRRPLVGAVLASGPVHLCPERPLLGLRRALDGGVVPPWDGGVERALQVAFGRACEWGLVDKLRRLSASKEGPFP